jgi:hypothetical protein
MLAAGALLVSVASWFVVRRKPRVAIAALLLAAGGLTLIARDRIRPAHESYEIDGRMIVAPRVVEHWREWRVYGAAPLPAAVIDPETARTSTFGMYEYSAKRFELRSASTPASMGANYSRNDWDGVTRSTRRTEIDTVSRVTVHAREGRRLVVDFTSPFPVHEVAGDWLCGNEVCVGRTAVAGRMKGTVTLVHDPERCDDCEDLSMRWPAQASDSSRVRLIGHRRGGVAWLEAPIDDPLDSFGISSDYVERDGAPWWIFALPAGRIRPGAVARVSLPVGWGSKSPTLVTAKRSVLLAPGGEGAQHFTRAWDIPDDVLREIIVEGGIVKVTMPEVPKNRLFNSTASIEIWEKKP